MDMVEGLRESKFFGVLKIIKFEKEVVYRSTFIHTLAKYLEIRYGGVDLQSILSNETMTMV